MKDIDLALIDSDTNNKILCYYHVIETYTSMEQIKTTKIDLNIFWHLAYEKLGISHNWGEIFKNWC